MIDVRNLTKYYGQRAAVDHITFQVERGPDRRLSRPQRRRQDDDPADPDRLHARHQRRRPQSPGFDVFSQSLQARRQIGYLPENVPLYTDMRVREYLTFRVKLRGMGRDDRDKRLKQRRRTCAGWAT